MSNKYVNEINQSLLLPHVKLGEPVWHLKWETSLPSCFLLCLWVGWMQSRRRFFCLPQISLSSAIVKLFRQNACEMENSILDMPSLLDLTSLLSYWQIWHTFRSCHTFVYASISGISYAFLQNTLFKEILNNPPVINFPLNLLLLSLYSTTHICYACSACFLMPKCSKTLNC